VSAKTSVIALAGRVRRFLAAFPLIPVGVLLIVLFSIIQPNFFSAANLVNVLTQASVLLIAATGMTFVILTAGIDLSVGAMMFLASAFVAATLEGGLWPVLVILLVPLLTVVLGAFNGTVVATTGVPAMLVTLATLQVFRGIGGHLTEQQSLVLPDSVRFLGLGDLAGIPRAVWVAAVVVFAGAYVLKRTRFGRHVQALGSNPSAAWNAGLPVRGLLITVYAIAGLSAGIASLVQVGRLGAVQPTLDVGFELTVITAVVLGGASLSGGYGSVAGTAVGALLLTTVENGLVLSGASPYVFDIFRGAVLLIAIVGSDLPRRLLRASRRKGGEAAITP
jgi:ribose/xylose/arabinose/galactoside ABC-type transport system permease subunit